MKKKVNFYRQFGVDYTGLPYGQIINETNDPTNEYYGTPCILKSSTGRYVMSHDIVGSTGNDKTTPIYYTDNINSGNWTLAQTLSDFIWGTLFEYSGDLYILGTSAYPTTGTVEISKSTDDGETWSAPATMLTIPGGYIGWGNTASNPIFKDGYLVKAFELRTSPIDRHRFVDCCMVFCDLTDLTDSGNWSYSNVVAFDGTAFEATEIAEDSAYTKYPFTYTQTKGFLEGSIIEKTGGNLIYIARLECAPASNYAVYMDITWNSGTPTSSTISSTQNFIYMPGGNLKFTVLWDSVTSKHWAIANLNKYRYFNDNRAQSYLMSSDDDCLTWTVYNQVAGYTFTDSWETEVEQYGAQYSHFIIDGSDIWCADRTADANANNAHNANLLTLTKIENYASLSATTYIDGCLILDENSARLEDVDGIAHIEDQSKYNNGAFMLDADNANKVTWNSGFDFSGSEWMRVIHDPTLNLNYGTGLSMFIVVENLQSVTALRILSKIAPNTQGISTSDWYYAVNVGLGIQNTRGVYTDLTTTNDYIFASSFDNSNEYIYNYLNGANRGAPDSVNDGSWVTDHIELGTTYTSGNFNELFIGKRDYTSPLYFTSLIKAIHIIPEYMDSTAMIAYMDALNAIYSIY